MEHPPSGLPKYDISQTYEWNYSNAPGEAPEIGVPACPGQWDFCGIPIDSPLGMPAGPLLNSAWTLYYARLGFSVLTYKTVRSAFRACYEAPNLLPVDAGQLSGISDVVTASGNKLEPHSWAISFGMPSRDPAVWRRDVEITRKGLAPGQVLSVSVVATPQREWTLEHMAEEFADCARSARDSGAQAVEANLSCPNVCTEEGQLYKSAEASAEIAARISAAIQGLPLILKIGLFDNREQAAAFVEAVDGHATALSTVNSISARVVDPVGRVQFGGLSRGIGGESIRSRCQSELAMLNGLIRERGSDLRLIGVGGIRAAGDVRERMSAGAHHVQLATSAMLDPLVAIRIRSEFAREDSGLRQASMGRPAGVRS